MYKLPYSFFFSNHLTYDLLAKYHLKNFYQIPRLESIILSLNFNPQNTKQILHSLLFLEIISLEKPFLIIAGKTKNTLKLKLKIKEGSILGCKVILKKLTLEVFLSNFIIEILPNYLMKLKKTKSQNLLKPTNTFNIVLKDLKLFLPYSLFYKQFEHLNLLTITFLFNKPLPLYFLKSLFLIPSKF